MLDIPDSRGLVCGYCVDASGAMTSLEWAEMDAALSADDSLVWLHFDVSDARARDWIGATPHVPPQGKALLLGTDRHMRIEAVGPGLAGVVGDLHHEFTAQAEQFDVLRLYLDNRILVSARRQPLAAVDKLRRALGEGLKADRPIALLTQFLHHVTDTFGDLILELADGVDRIEEALLEGQDAKPGDELGRIRRLSARLRRHMVPQQHVLFGLLSRLPAWVEEADATRLRSAIERLAALGHDIELVQERARLLQEQVSARVAEATSRNLYMLSIVTTLFLPMTLITGLFGMNLGGLPGTQDPFGFWWGVAIMLLTGLATLVVLRRLKML